jgi:hypothetical protein
MPRYFFHLRDAQKALMDCEGSVLPDAAAARQQAILSVRDFLRPAIGQVDPDWVGWWLDVRDERGRRILDIALGATAREAECSPPPAPSKPARNVIPLESERARRLARGESQTRDLLQRTHDLIEQQHRAALNLAHQLHQIQQICASTAKLVARARNQSAANSFDETVIGHSSAPRHAPERTIGWNEPRAGGAK